MKRTHAFRVAKNNDFHGRSEKLLCDLDHCTGGWLRDENSGIVPARNRGLFMRAVGSAEARFALAKYDISGGRRML